VYYVDANFEPHKTMTVTRPGTQCVVLNIRARTGVRIEHVSFGFSGPPEGMPEDEGHPTTFPELVGELPSRITRGKTDPDHVRIPGLLPRGEYINYNRQFVPWCPWEGEVRLGFTLLTADGQMDKIYVQRLPFCVRAGPT
jgi:hypothetical protein